jgi:hypothetical protein
MGNFRAALAAQKAQAYAHPHLLGNFVDNHDGARFLYEHSGDEAIVGLGRIVALCCCLSTYHRSFALYQFC